MGLVIIMVGSHSHSHSLVIGTIMVNKAALAECPVLVECLAMVDLNLGIGIDLNLDTGVNLFLNPGHSPMWSTTHQFKMALVVQKKPRLPAMVLASLMIGSADLGALRKEILG